MHYGLLLARHLSFPEEVLSRASWIAKEIEAKDKSDAVKNINVRGSNKLKEAYSLAQKIVCLAMQRSQIPHSQSHLVIKQLQNLQIAAKKWKDTRCRE